MSLADFRFTDMRCMTASYIELKSKSRQLIAIKTKANPSVMNVVNGLNGRLASAPTLLYDSVLQPKPVPGPRSRTGSRVPVLLVLKSQVLIKKV